MERAGAEWIRGYSDPREVSGSLLAQQFVCREDRSGQDVVLRLIRAPHVADRALVNRILRDGRLMQGLRQHANLARVVDVGESVLGSFVVHERATAGAADIGLAPDNVMPVARALGVARDIARALAGLAGIAVVHRDVCPANVTVDADGAAKLFGASFAVPIDQAVLSEARLLLATSRDGSARPDAALCGTAATMAPELVLGAPHDARSDLYALGATVFALMTGASLFTGSVAEVLAAHVRRPVPSIARLVPGANLATVELVYRLLEKDPARRPQTPAEALALVEAALARAARDEKRGSSPASLRALAERGAAAEPDAPPFAESAESPYLAAPTGVLGSLKQMGVVEILQTLEMGKKNARVDVQEQAGAVGELYVHDGQLVSAQVRARALDGAALHAGEAAVVAMLGWRAGVFRIHYAREEVARNIARPTTFVILDALRQVDEAAQGSPAAAPPQPARAAVARTVDSTLELTVPVAAVPADPAESSPHSPSDDPTLPQAPVPPRRVATGVSRGAPPALDAARAALAAATAHVLRLAHGANRAAEAALVAQRPRLARAHPVLGELPAWAFVAIACGAVVVLGWVSCGTAR